MGNTIPLNDPLNLRDFIARLTDTIREKGGPDAAPKSIVGFLALILPNPDAADAPKDGGVSPAEPDAAKPQKPSNVSTMQRLLSGNIPYSTKAVQSMADEICSGSRDAELLESMAVVANAILGSTEGSDYFEKRLYPLISFRFFSDEELRTLRSLLDEKDYPRFLLELLKHGFGSLYNLPCFFSQRMYEEAVTCDFDSPHRYALMKAAADNGSRDAALEYANYLARHSDSGADEYFLMAIPRPSAVWAIAYQLEIGWIGRDRLPKFQNAFRVDEKLNGPEFEPYRQELEGIVYGGQDPEMKETMLYIYRVYFYLAYTDYFKGFHSMAKQLESGTIRFDGPGSAEKTARLRKKYRDASIKASVVISSMSEGNYLLQKQMEDGKYEPGSEAERRSLELLELGAEMDLLYGNYHLGEYYEYISRRDPGKPESRKIANAFYMRAAQLDTDGNGRQGKLWLKLGLVSDSPEEKRKYFEMALDARQWDAAYYLADMEMNRYMSGGESALLHLYSAYKYLREYLPMISGENRSMANLLYRGLCSLFEENSENKRGSQT